MTDKKAKIKRIKSTIYMPEDVLWGMRERGAKERISTDSEMITEAVSQWIGRKQEKEIEVKHEEAAPQVKRRRA